MSKLMPKYTPWEAISVALDLGKRALEEIRTLARTPGPQGPAGKDGLGFDDVDVVDTPDKGWMLIFERDGVVKKFRLPIITDRGVYQEGKAYFKGDSITFQGQTYIAQGDTSAKPHTPEAKSDWRLSVKRGSDGRDGKDFVSEPLPSVKIGKAD